MTKWERVKKVLAKQYHPSVTSMVFQNMLETMNDHPKLRPHIAAYALLHNITATTADLKKRIAYEKRIERQVGIRWALDGALNGGRDQPDWIEESNRNLLMFLSGECPSWIKDQVVYDDHETPWLTKRKIQLKWKLLEWHYRFNKMSTLRAMAMGATLVATPAILYAIYNSIV
ncbi:hypothetical protein [Vibrio phage vB_VpS_PG28]|nr:hypothetical protein [Vibrio phage vB_VpS_PG28]